MLALAFTDGTTVKLGFFKDRDEAFNTIIGFSGLRWQVLQDAVEKGEDGKAQKGGASGTRFEKMSFSALLA